MTTAQPSNDHGAPELNTIESHSGPSEVERTENVKHLEFIQAIVTRLATNSFLIKGWALTVAAAAFGFAVNRVDSRIAIAGSVVTVGFWLLDAYYLRQERLFRHLYNYVRRNIRRDPQDRFSMNLNPFTNNGNVKRINVFFSITLGAYYPLLVAAGALIALLSATTSPAPTTPDTTSTSTTAPPPPVSAAPGSPSTINQNPATTPTIPTPTR